MGSLDSFGQTATKLSQNPLGIIALFIVLVYGFASLVVGIGKNLDARSISILVWFMVTFPVLVLIVFAWLVSQHSTKLYAPRDFKKDEHFLQAIGLEIGNLRYVEPSPIETDELKSGEPHEKTSHEEYDIHTRKGRSIHRNEIYRKNRNLYLAHVISPSTKSAQVYDIQIYLKRHMDDAIEDVASASFFFGKSWGNRIFEGTKERNLIGVSTAAYGSFLCTCLVKFVDGEEVTLDRYIDFEMGKVITRTLQTAAIS